jgi:plastocyanin
MRALLLLGLAGCAGGTSTLRGVVSVRNAPISGVFVHLKEGVPAGPYPVPAEPVTLKQHGMEFVPRVFGLRAGQALRITSEDTTPHNVFCAPFRNEAFNFNMNEGEAVLKRFDKAETMVEFQCHLHFAMRAFAGVLDHPYFAVTDRDGRFEIPGVPAGRYRIAAWDEGLGTKETQVELPGAPVRIDFP